MTRHEIVQRLTRLAFALTLGCGLTAAPAFAATTVADFESLSDPLPGPTSGPNTTQFVTHQFNTGSGQQPAAIANDAAHAAINDYLEIVPEQGNERNTVAFDQTAPGLYQTINVSYDFRITNTTGTPADGLGMALLNIDYFGTTGYGGGGANFAQENAPTQSLNFGLDDYNNGTSGGHNDPSNNHAEFAFNGTANIAIGNINTSDLILANGKWNHVDLTLQYVTGGTLATAVITPDVYGTPGTPVTVFDHQLLAGVTPYQARVAFGAGTGGSDAQHDIDNVVANYNVNGQGFNYTPDFSDPSAATQFVFNHSGTDGTGIITDGSGHKIIQLTTAANDEKGTAWYKDKQTVKNGFTSQFTFEFPNPNNSGADGMAFVIQNVGTTLLAANDGPSANALFIDFDSYFNSTSNDPSAAFVRLIGNGTIFGTHDFVADPNFSFSDLSGSGVHNVRVVYLDGKVTMYMDNHLVFNNIAIDLGAIGAMDANGQSYVGFSARTGGANEEHNVLSFSFASAVPEPASMAMFALGGLVLVRRRRRD